MTTNLSSKKISERIPFLALQLMLISILLPTILYALKLSNPTPAGLLVTICVSLFASLIYLWILDATGVLTFRREWISKSIYGAAIVSILGTSAGVYKDYFNEDKYPYCGKWLITMINNRNNHLSENEIVMAYSKNSSAYYGFSNFVEHTTDSTLISNVEIKKLLPEDELLVYQVRHMNGETKTYQHTFIFSTNKKQIIINTDSSDLNRYKIILSRPNT